MKANTIILGLLLVTGSVVVTRQLGGRKSVTAELVPIAPPVTRPAQFEAVNQGPFHAANLGMWQDRVAFELTGHEDGVLSLAFSPDSKYLVSGSADRTVRVWDIAGRKEIRKLQGHADIVTSVSYSADGRLIVSTGRDNAAIVWDAATGQIVTLYQHYEALRGARFLPDGHVVTITENHIALWGPDDWRPIAREAANWSTWQLAVSPAGEIATGNARGEIEVWNAKTLEQVSEKARPHNTKRDAANCIYNLTYLDSHRLLISDVAGTWIWDRATDAVEPQRSGTMAAVVPLWDSGLFVGTDDFGLWCWGGKESESVALWSVPYVPRALGVTPSGKWLAVGGGGAWMDHMKTWVSKGPTAIRLYDVEQMPAYAEALEKASPSNRPKRSTWIASEQRMIEQGGRDFPREMLPWE